MSHDRKSITSSIRKLLALFGITIIIILFSPVTEWLHAPLIVDEVPHDAQVLIILSTNQAHSVGSGLLDYATTMRVRKGMELLRRFRIGNVIVVGGNRMSTTGVSIAGLMRDELIQMGIDPAMIIVQDAISGDYRYYENLMAIQDSPSINVDFNDSMIVTSSHNTFRIKQVFLHLGFNPTVVSASPYAMFPANWHYRLENFRDAANEYWAIMLFYFLGRIG
jgi:uncharacterized SAM-binding protein YcdF (DUF218 family)